MCLLICTLGISLSANGQEHKASFVTFDAPGAGTGHREGTIGISINPSGVIVGHYLDANDTFHGFVRDRDGAFTTFDLPGQALQGTFTYSNNPKGTATGYYVDANNVPHGFVRASDGTITDFDAPGAGTGAGQGTAPWHQPCGCRHGSLG